MTVFESWLPLAAFAVPLAASALIVGSARRPNLREMWTLLAAGATFVVVAAMLPQVLDGRVPERLMFEIVPGMRLALRADGLGMVLGLSASALWLLTSVYSIGYVRALDEHKQTRYFASFSLCIAAAIGMAFSANLLTFFVFYEALTAATYPLVIHKESPEALAAGRRYLAYLLTGGVSLLLATGFLQSRVGDLTFQPGGFVQELSQGEVLVVLALFVVGFGSKAAVMPLHAWLPSAMVAPTPVSALLHAVAVVKAGVFGFARAIGFVIGPATLGAIGGATALAVLAAVTIVVASFAALRQDNLKRRLAFSTIAHLSYIVLGLSLLSATAWNGALLHIVNHAALKITLFFCAGALYAHAHLDRVSQLDGIGRRMPVTMAAFGLASVGLAGFPPMGGFVSKAFLGLGAFDAESLLFAAVILLGGLLTAAYLFPIVYRAFFVAPPPEALAEAPAGEASPMMVAPLAITAALALLLGLGDLFGMHALASGVAAAVSGAGP